MQRNFQTLNKVSLTCLLLLSQIKKKRLVTAKTKTYLASSVTLVKTMTVFEIVVKQHFMVKLAIGEYIHNQQYLL